jgi:hypothetical protein
MSTESSTTLGFHKQVIELSLITIISSTLFFLGHLATQKKKESTETPTNEFCEKQNAPKSPPAKTF